MHKQAQTCTEGETNTNTKTKANKQLQVSCPHEVACLPPPANWLGVKHHAKAPGYLPQGFARCSSEASAGHWLRAGYPHIKPSTQGRHSSTGPSTIHGVS